MWLKGTEFKLNEFNELLLLLFINRGGNCGGGLIPLGGCITASNNEGIFNCGAGDDEDWEDEDEPAY